MFLKSLRQGFGNRLFVCQVEQEEIDSKRHLEKEAPQKVLVRLFGGNVLPRDAPIRTMNETCETLVFYALGVKGFGPKLYGSFEGGRLEEFIQSTPISVKDWCQDPGVNKSVAKLVAEYHSQDFPLDRNPWNLPKIMDTCYAKYLTQKDKVKEMVKPEDYEAAKDFFEFDVITERDWMKRVLPLINSRVVFSHTDVNRGNHLIRDSDKKIVLIDYEFSGYNYRGFEAGNYFCMKMFDFGSDKFKTGYSYPSESYRKEFIQTYIDKIKEIGFFADWDDNARDSFDHIWMETEFGSFACRLVNIVWCLRDVISWLEIMEKRKVVDPGLAFGEAFTLFTTFYRERKKLFLETYPQFNV